MADGMQSKIATLMSDAFLVATLIPIVILYLVNSDIYTVEINGTLYTLADADPIINVIIGSLIPIFIALGVMMRFVKTKL